VSRSRRNKSRGNANANANGNANRNGNTNAGGNGVGTHDFWGTVLRPDDVEQPVIESPDPTAMVRSLGIPPLAGNRPISEHYFAAVYGKAAGLAQALLAAERPVADRDPTDLN
jgi:hypothetical protein